MSIRKFKDAMSGYMYPVEEKMMHLATGESVPHWKALTTIRDSQEKVIHVVRDSYKLLQNSEILIPLNEAMEKIGLNPQLDQLNTNICASDYDLTNMQMHIYFKDHKLTYHDVGDVFLGLFVYNSYNGLIPARVRVGCYRVICSNGAYVMDTEALIEKRHTKGLTTEELIRFVEKSFADTSKYSARYERLQSVPVSKKMLTGLYNLIPQKQYRDYLSMALGRLSIEIGDNWKSDLDQLPETLNIPFGGYDLYNVTTEYITRASNFTYRVKYFDGLNNIMQAAIGKR